MMDSVLRIGFSIGRVARGHKIVSHNLNRIQNVHSSATCCCDSPRSSENDVTNVSGLRPHLRSRMKHVNYEIPNPNVAHTTSQLRSTYRRKLYAKHGASSGVDPGFMWPSKEELAEMRKIEDEFEPSLQERWAVSAKEKAEIESTHQAREAMVVKGMAAMPKYIADYKNRLRKAEEEQAAVAAKQQEMMEEARDFYGYEISRNDPRFILMMEQKEEEAKEAKKQKKKEDREANMKRVLSELTKRKSRSKKSSKAAEQDDD